MRKTPIKCEINVPTVLYEATKRVNGAYRAVINCFQRLSTPSSSSENHGFRKIFTPLSLSVLIHIILYTLLFYAY